MSLTALYDVPAPAKVNLFLHVTGRRADGYHLLQSVFLLIDWCDTLHFERRDDGRLFRIDLGPAVPDDDLCLRAARLLQQASGCRDGAQISLDKHVPWGAGLGGGSSDAASTLVALNRLWGLHWPRSRLLSLALQLGADVPFFVGGHNAWVEGIGEQLTPISLPFTGATLVAVLKPAIAVPTQAIFASDILSRQTPPAIVADFLAEPFGFGRNDLQAAAARYATAHEAGAADGTAARRSKAGAPKGAGEIDRALDLLARTFSSSRMTGSGSAVFAHAGSQDMLEISTGKLEQLLATDAQGWSGRLCRTLAAHPLQEWTQD
jgi:4-diphosphocytidyl-2-C-methyl-D-erythritol kinase